MKKAVQGTWSDARVTMSHLTTLACALGMLVLSVAPLWAQTSRQATNLCVVAGQDQACTSDRHCEDYPVAKACIDGHCNAPCKDQDGRRAPYLCSMGETCEEGIGPAGKTYYCRAGAYMPDRNLLNMCTSGLVGDRMPDLSASPSNAPCDLERNLNQLLDHDGDKMFTIHDVPGCVEDFKALPTCPDKQHCPAGFTYCQADADCGEGLFCDPEKHWCARECGFVPNRNPDGPPLIERQCSGERTLCNYKRGRCDSIAAPLDKLTCQVDGDCPSGAYCFLGKCAAKCNRAIDCPDSTWFCSLNNRCTPVPPGAAGEDFDPRDYVIQFAEKEISLNPIQQEQEVRILIMDLKQKKQVFSNPSVVFGYRMEVEYATKQDAKCLKPSGEWSEDDKRDCRIDDTEQFVTLLKPFGTIFADGVPTIGIRLNQAAVDRLTPGRYRATLRAIYNNGSYDTTSVSFTKTTLSGEYSGQLTVHAANPEVKDPTRNHLGNTRVSMKLFLDETKPPIQWQELLAKENLKAGEDLFDITEGIPVRGYIHGNDSMIFDWPHALSKSQNEIPLRGIYSARLGIVRLVAVIDLDKNHCVSESGRCSDQPNELQVRNIFGRKVRRLIQFLGPFDPKTRRFHGMYRETVSGLAPFDITVNGGFRLDQQNPDATPLPIGTPLLSPTSAPPVGFPSHQAILAEIEKEITDSCPATPPNAPSTHFDNAERFTAYLRQLDVPELRNGRIFPDLVRFESAIQSALNALKQSVLQPDTLTLYDYLQGTVFFCSPTSNRKSCISEEKTRCGLALHRKAILSGWMDPGTLTDSRRGEHVLFCSPIDPPGDCQVSAREAPALVTLQEHNRFYREYTQALKYQADSELSNASFALYRYYESTLSQADALKSKQTALMKAWGWFAQMRREMFSAPSTVTLTRWPMRVFAGLGKPWLDQMHTTLQDRLEALDQLLDLKRRVFVNATEQDYTFVQHVLHEEYLSQVYLMAMQQEWQGELFAYAGEGPRVLAFGETLLARVNETRNPLGFHPNQVFFENSDLTRINWENYKRQLTQGGMGGTGRLGAVKQAIVDAIADLKSALNDKHTLLSRLQTARQAFEQEVDQLCGPEIIPDGKRECQLLPMADRRIEANCVGENCKYKFRCEGEECKSVVQMFNQGVGDSLENVSCRIDTPNLSISWGTEKPRQCVRGQMGALLQEKAQLELQRAQIYRQVDVLLRRIEAQRTVIEKTQSENKGLIDYLKLQGTLMKGIEAELIASEFSYAQAVHSAEAGDCLVIVGTASGSNCPQKVAKAAQLAIAEAGKNAFQSVLRTMQAELHSLKEIKFTEVQQQTTLLQLRTVLDSLGTEVENAISQYELVTRQLLNLNMRLQDTHYLAEQAAKRYTEDVEDIVRHLSDFGSGNVLRRNAKVQEANAEFKEVLRLTYKMAMAFIHSYNLKEQSEQIIARVFNIVTPRGVEELIETLEHLEDSYCGGAGVDCDAPNNTHYLRFSVRDELFPSLRDIVDARSGKVLAKGEQFHNLITSSTFRHRRMVGTEWIEQIEIPFSIWLNTRENSGARQPYMLPPGECNHIVVGRGSGSIAANIVGSRLQTLEYEIYRGNTDFLRQCTPEEVLPPGGGQPITVYPTNGFVIGYAPSSILAQQDEPPQFVTHNRNTACRNEVENNQGFVDRESCYFFYARDRSLAAPDWKFVIPLKGFNNEWLLGEGLAESEKPIISDIVLYVRYRTRPVDAH